MTKLSVFAALSALAVAAQAGPQAETGRSQAAPTPVFGAAAPSASAPALGEAAALPPVVVGPAPIEMPAGPATSAEAAAVSAAASAASAAALPAFSGSAEAGQERAAVRVIEQGTADWAKKDDGEVAGGEAAGQPRLQARSSAGQDARSRESRAPEPPRRPEEPRGMGGRMLLGQFMTALSVMPLVVGVIGAAGATPLIVGVALLFPGLVLVFRSRPPKDAFFVLLAMFGGLFSSFSLAGVLMHGDPGNAWIAGAILGVAGLGMAAADEIGKKRVPGSSGARQASTWVAFAGYLGGLATMFLLKDWHNGLGVLLGVGIVAVIGAGSLLLPPLFDALKKLLARGGDGGGAAPAGPSAPSPAWAKLAGMQKALIWGGFAVGAAASLLTWLFAGSAAWAPVVLGFAPMAGLFAGVALHRYARRRAGL